MTLGIVVAHGMLADANAGAAVTGVRVGVIGPQRAKCLDPRSTSKHQPRLSVSLS